MATKAAKATKILIKKIITDPKYYPRQEVDQKRILEFVEAMECDEHFPPIKVVYIKKIGKYVLLDGKHRLEAYILRGEIEILAYIFDFPEEHWLMVSARFNGKSSKPLKGEEIKQIITQTWQSGIKDTTVIAKEMNLSVRYVEKMLKTARDEERDKRKEEILELHQQGMSQREIAFETGFSPSCISKILKLHDGSNTYLNPDESISRTSNDLIESVQMFPKRTEFVLETSNEDNDINKLNDIETRSDSAYNEIIPITSIKVDFHETISNKSILKPNEDISGTPDAHPEIAQMFPKRTEFVL